MAKPYALVTGASRGIGRETALLLAGKGFPLILVARNQTAALAEVADLCRDALALEAGLLPDRAVFTYLTDLSDAAAVREMFDDLNAKGIGRSDTCAQTIGVLVNNAGIAHYALVQDMSDDDWRRVMGVNIDSMFYTCRAVVPIMVYDKSGVIINVSSYWGEQGAAMESAYAASKGAVNAFTRSLEEELQPSGIRVHLVAPEFVDTEMNAHLSEEERLAAAAAMPSGRIWQAKEIAEKILDLVIT